MILADTSAWIEYQRGTGSRSDRRIQELIETDSELAFTEPVLMEFVAGAATSATAERLRRLLVRTRSLPFDAGADFDIAAEIYRRCRTAGVTPRGFIDCMIAAVAFRTGASILTANTDLVRIAGIMAIPLDVE
ncbi:MAG TPA: PIN domain-containing protein [Baekduia sp.]|nr:PIN domain-containing protein [Baekduia sp.]